MRVGIIGCGYVGQAVARHWKDQNHFVSVTTRHPQRLPELQKIADQVFVIEDEGLFPFLREQEAVLISVAPDHPSDYRSTYLETAREVVEILPDTKQLKQILYTSSTSVYGDHGGDWVDETTVLTPWNENAAILQETEQLLLRQESKDKDVKIAVFRLGEIYGPGREIEGRLKRLQGRPLPGDGSSLTNLIHVNEIVRAIDFALENGLHGIFNLCEDLHMTRREFYELLCRQNYLPPVQWDPSLKNHHSGNKKVSNQKIKDLGFFL